ncbi:sulfatase-like hydrolase/transferase [Calycomorphotria hydatis]|uniref:Arylsulfatase n=1 Tax=Calycomorphotria hydatis TaxID=2528027 RepID=A0A517T391_9PLAN|nr:sulfatase-like hydrolase/transferase [Calycomorphotria hydatis]QDT62845.1 Arylsulfatase precursor [Calycomorphotria hydatis]
MLRKVFLLLAASLLTCLTVEAAERPNIVMMMVDDLGWNHISVDNATMETHLEKYDTPNLEKFAAGGLSFTHCYVQPNCAPTRAAMLSGQYPARVHNRVYVVNNLNRFGGGGITRKSAKYVGPEQSEDVAPEAITVAEALQENGYRTAHIGKFHVGGHSGEQTLPENVGFDINIGGSSDGHQSACFASKKKNGNTWEFRRLGSHHFDKYADPYSKEYLHRRKLPKSLINTPKHVSDALGDALTDTIQLLAEDDQPFYIQFHTYAVHSPVRARPDLVEAAESRLKSISNKEAQYLGFIAGVDENVGRLQAALADPNGDGDDSDSILNNTLVLFTSDNGGTHADNLPLKGKKGMLSEGGIRVPLIASWPGTVPAGTNTNRSVHAVDFYPTYLDLAGNNWMPSDSKHPLDGESFASILTNPLQPAERGPIHYLFPGYLDKRATPSIVTIQDVNDRRYKLYYFYETDSWELYCLSNDMGEATNVIDTENEVATLLSQSMHDWLTQQHPTWQPEFPIHRRTNMPALPPNPLN